MKCICLVAALCICNLAAFSQINFFSRPASRKPALPTAAHAAQRFPQLHVVYVEEQNELEMARVNLENDSLLAPVIRTIANGLGYQIQNWRIPKEHFTRQTLKETIASIPTHTMDIIIVYFSGYGIPIMNEPNKLANWRLDDVRDRGLAVSELEKWVLDRNVHLGLILADYKAKSSIIESIPELNVVRKVNLLTDILRRLFIHTCGIIKLGSTLHPKKTDLAGSPFTSAFCAAFDSLLDFTGPADLPDLSFQALHSGVELYMRDSIPTTIYEANSCIKSSAFPRPNASLATSAGASRGAKWQGFRGQAFIYERLPQKPPLRKLGKPFDSAIDLSKYTPPVIDQGEQGKCVAVAIGYYMRSTMEAIKLNLTDKDEIRKHSFSPAYLYNVVKDPNDNNCTAGIYAEQALEVCKRAGILTYDKAPDNSFCLQDRQLDLTYVLESRILDYVKLFSTIDNKTDKIQATKQALSERSPVVVGIELTPSIANLSFSRLFFTKLKNSVTQLIASDAIPDAIQWDPAQSNTLDYGHAMCVVGYDDKVLGGAFKLINSWGKNWGDDGFFWITYKNFARFAKYGYQAYLPTDQQPVVLSADIALHHASSPNKPLAATPLPYSSSLTEYRINAPFKTGTSLHLDIQATTQAYVYVLTATRDSPTTSLFPYGQCSPLLSANTLMDLTKDSLLTLTGKPGMEYLLFLFANKPISNLDQIRNQLQTQPGTFPQRAAAVLAKQLPAPSQLRFKPKKVGFFVSKSPAEPAKTYIAPVLVSINHVD